jgi:hypothetical protein
MSKSQPPTLALFNLPHKRLPEYDPMFVHRASKSCPTSSLSFLFQEATYCFLGIDTDYWTASLRAPTLRLTLSVSAESP